MTKLGKIIIGVIILLVAITALLFLGSKNESKEEPILDKLVVENEILGKKEDLVSFNVLPGAKIPASALSFSGEIKGGWFFEGNILINILDADKNVIKSGNATATTDWQTSEPVSFSGTIDLAGLPAGPAFFQIHNDNASGEAQFDKFIQIPIIIQ